MRFWSGRRAGAPPVRLPAARALFTSEPRGARSGRAESADRWERASEGRPELPDSPGAGVSRLWPRVRRDSDTSDASSAAGRSSSSGAAESERPPGWPERLGRGFSDPTPAARPGSWTGRSRTRLAGGPPAAGWAPGRRRRRRAPPSAAAAPSAGAPPAAGWRGAGWRLKKALRRGLSAAAAEGAGGGPLAALCRQSLTGQDGPLSERDKLSCGLTFTRGGARLASQRSFSGERVPGSDLQPGSAVSCGSRYRGCRG